MHILFFIGTKMKIFGYRNFSGLTRPQNRSKRLFSQKPMTKNASLRLLADTLRESSSSRGYFDQNWENLRLVEQIII